MREETAARAAELVAARVPFVQATVVRAHYPTSAHAGDSALVLADGRVEGFVGGTCAETSVQVHALEVLRTGEPLLLRILPGAASTLREVGAVTVANPCLSGGTLEIFLEPRTPARRVVIVGDTPVARALAAAAATLGFAVELAGGAGVRPAPDDAALVVASHGRAEEVALEAALRAGVPYVGLVASRTRGAAVLASLDVHEALRASVHSPAGLPIGARTTEEIALSIAAELVAERAARRARVVPADPVSTQGAHPDHAAAIDPVCGMTVPTGGAALRVDGDGGSVWFCSHRCRAAYVGDPARHATAR